MSAALLNGLKTFRQNFFASITVALVAIPLCLGIAMASGAPLFAGVLTGVIGGIVVGLISESRVSVSGPAAGMVAVVIYVVSGLGSYPLFLLALLIAGVMQIIAGILRGGFIANYIPTNVIQGLLAAIGILIIIKQIPIAIGYTQDPGTLAKAIEDSEKTLNVSYFLKTLHHVHMGVLIITLLSLAILLLWEKKFARMARIIPASVVVVCFSIAANKFMHAFYPKLSLRKLHLVNMPILHSFSDFLHQLRFPDFSGFTNIHVYTYAAMIAAVASLETLLNLEGIEKIDKRHRYTSRNREMVAQGVGNIFSGFLGGLPITSVIVRSSVNIYAGATSKLSTILHGIILIASLTFISRFLNQIPLAALAAILIYTGYKLASVSLFRKVYAEGMRYFLPFLVTVVAIVFSNLLTGVLIGLSVSILFILYYNSRNGLIVVNEKHPHGDVMRFILPQQITFLNKAFMVDALNKINRDSKVIIDAYSTDYIDNDVLGVIKDFKDEQAPEKNILLNLTGFKSHYDIQNGLNFINATTRDVQSQLTHQQVLNILIEGNKRFVNGTPIHKDFKHQIQATSQSQHPIGVVLSCIDSRVPVEIVFDLTLGDLFVTRIAGNIANTDILGSIEFACHVAQAKLVVVLGHKECGAVKAACDHFEFGHITQLLHKIEPAIAMTEKAESHHHVQKISIDQVVQNNVLLTKNYLIEKSDALRKLFSENKINIVGAVYDVHTGEVVFLT